MADKYLVEVDYYCPNAAAGGQWFVIESDSIPKVGVIDRRPFESGPLPMHNCMKYHNSDNCDGDSSCYWQNILQILPFTEEGAKRLKAESLDCLIKK